MIRPLRGVPRRLAAGLLLALVLTGCTGSGDGTFSLTGTPDANGFSYPTVDRKPITELAGPQLGGTATLSTAQFKGQVVVINFWGTWCGDCRVEASDLQDASVSLKAQGVQFLGVNVRDTSQDAGTAYEKAKQITYPSIYDPGQRTLLALRGVPSNAIPLTLVLDRSGRVAHLWPGRVTENALVATVSAVAAEH